MRTLILQLLLASPLLGTSTVISETNLRVSLWKKPSMIIRISELLACKPIRISEILACKPPLLQQGLPERTSRRVHVNTLGLFHNQRIYLGKRRERRVFFQTPNAEWRAALTGSGWHRGQQKVWKGTRDLIIWVKFQRRVNPESGVDNYQSHLKKQTLIQIQLCHVLKKPRTWPIIHTSDHYIERSIVFTVTLESK